MTSFLAANWLWIAFIVAMSAMHRHGCGMHGGHHDHASESEHAHHGSRGTNPALPTYLGCARALSASDWGEP